MVETSLYSTNYLLMQYTVCDIVAQHDTALELDTFRRLNLSVNGKGEYLPFFKFTVFWTGELTACSSLPPRTRSDSNGDAMENICSMIWILSH